MLWMPTEKKPKRFFKEGLCAVKDCALLAQKIRIVPLQKNTLLCIVKSLMMNRKNMALSEVPIKGIKTKFRILPNVFLTSVTLIFRISYIK